eukprot:3817835-Amphidinium_carterae.1
MSDNLTEIVHEDALREHELPDEAFWQLWAPTCDSLQPCDNLTSERQPRVSATGNALALHY